jgi:hypothetical protein
MDHQSPQISQLLDLPRELRDYIYSYLRIEIDFSWHWTHPVRHSHQAVPPTIRVQLHNAPHPIVLQVSPGIRAEYLETLSTHGISATIRLGVYKSPFDILSTDHTLCVETLPAIIKAHLRHVTLLIDCGCGEHPNPSFWGRINKLADVLHEQAPTLAVLKIALQYRARGRLPSHTEQYKYWTRPTFLHAPHLILAKLPLMQRCEGYRLEQYNGMGAVSLPKRHAVVINGCYLYTRGGYEKYLWSAAEVVGRSFEVNAYNVMVEDLPRDVLNHEMRKWREVRGHGDLVKWDEAEEQARLALSSE